MYLKYKLKDLVSFGLGLTATPHYVSSGIPFLSSKNISNDYIDFSDIKYISKDDYIKASNSAKPRIGDILFTRVGSNLGHPVIVETNTPFIIFVSLGFLRTKSQCITNYYLLSWMNSDHFWKQVKSQIAGSSKFNLNIGWLEEFSISIPNIDEQTKVANMLKLINQRIDTQSKIIEKYESLIKVINQMMCNFDHEKIQVQNVFDFKEKTKHQANMGNSQGNFIYFTNEESTYKYFDSYDFDGEYIIANTGGKANFKYYNGKFAVMSDCLVMECNDNQNTKFYLYSILNRIDYINQVCFVGSGLKHLDKKLFLKTFITKFNKNLEPFINLIILLEKKISNDKILLQKLKEQKKYLLSNMFI